MDVLIIAAQYNNATLQHRCWQIVVVEIVLCHRVVRSGNVLNKSVWGSDKEWEREREEVEAAAVGERES